MNKLLTVVEMFFKKKVTQALHELAKKKVKQLLVKNIFQNSQRELM